MICRNCGFRNAPRDRFCGSCGRPLEWSGEQAGAPEEPAATDETSVSRSFEEPSGLPYRPPPAPYGPEYPPEPPQMAHPAQSQAYGAIACWNCGRRNPPSRSFCLQCGERLTVSSLGGAHHQMGYRESSGRGRMVGIAIGLLAILLLAGGAAAVFFGGSGPGALPTDVAVTSPSPETTTGPTEVPTLEPAPVPTENQPTAAPTAPPPAVPDCSSSTVPTNWANLSGADTSVRVRRDEYWCIHQVIVVPDPNFGEGRIRLRVDGQTLVEVTHVAGGQVEYPHAFQPAHLVPPRTDVEYRMNCAGDFCNSIIQIGYERYVAP